MKTATAEGKSKSFSCIVSSSAWCPSMHFAAHLCGSVYLYGSLFHSGETSWPSWRMNLSVSQMWQAVLSTENTTAEREWISMEWLGALHPLHLSPHLTWEHVDQSSLLKTHNCHNWFKQLHTCFEHTRLQVGMIWTEKSWEMKTTTCPASQVSLSWCMWRLSKGNELISESKRPIVFGWRGVVPMRPASTTDWILCMSHIEHMLCQCFPWIWAAWAWTTTINI